MGSLDSLPELTTKIPPPSPAVLLQGSDSSKEKLTESGADILASNNTPEVEMGSYDSIHDLTSEVQSPPAVNSSDLQDVMGEPEEGNAKSICIETKSSIVTVTKKPVSEDGFSVPDVKKRARVASPKKGNSGVELSNSFSPLEKSPSSKKQAVSVVEDSEADTSNSSASQPRVDSCRPKPQGLRSEPKICPPMDVVKREKTNKETKIPSFSTPSTGERGPRKPRFSREDFVKGPKEKPSQSKQEKTGKKHS